MRNCDDVFKRYTKDIIFILDNKGYVVDISRAAECFFKVGGLELIGKDLIEHLKYVNLTLFPNIHLLDNMKKFPVIDLFYHHTLDKKLYLFTINKYDAGHNELNYVFCGNEISDSELKNINFSSIIDSLPGALYWKDKEGRYIGCNSFVLEMAGFTQKTEIIGKTDYDLCWSEFADQWRNADMEVIETGNEIIKEESAKLANGRIITELTHKAPLKNKQGEIIGIIGNSLDISDKKELEAQLIQAKKQAEISSKAKSDFIANMSHDIRTPITGMLGLAQSIYDLSGNENIKNDVTLLVDTTNELLTFFNEILDVARIENGYQKNDDDIFSIVDTVNHNLKLLRPSAKHKNIELECQIESDVPKYVKGNHIYFDRIILNILSNAIKFTKKGCVNISVSQISKDSDNSTLRIIIKDTGIGMPRDKIDTIFENFCRLTPSYQGIYKGSGLGLFTVKQYLNAMGGVISVNSKENEGSVFIVDLSMKIFSDYIVDEFSDVRTLTPPLIDEVSNIDSIPAEVNILVVEDNLLAARMAGQIIEKIHCKYAIAENAKEALKQVRNNRYDLILMDIGLPDINGFDLTRKIRKIDHKVPVVALTGHVSSEKQQECINSGMQKVISKPISIDQCKELIKKYCLQQLPYKYSENLIDDDPVMNLPIIDLDEGKRLTGNNLCFAKEMITELLKTLNDDITEALNLEKKNDIDGLSKCIHKLYGGLCYCGVPRLRALTGKLNDLLKKKKFESIRIKLEKIAIEADNVIGKWKEAS